MSKPKPLSKEVILGAVKKTKSVRAASRYLNVSYSHLKIWMKLYTDDETGLTLFEKYKNRQGKGIPKFLGKKGLFSIEDIINGTVPHENFTPEKIKNKLIAEGYLDEKCNRCSFCEYRALDMRMPLLLNFRDKNKRNYNISNLQLLCYNCFYLTVGDIFTNRQIQGIEDHKSLYKSNVDEWELTDYHKQRLQELGLGEEEIKDEDDGSDLISRI
jgi:hypothetical protein